MALDLEMLQGLSPMMRMGGQRPQTASNEPSMDEIIAKIRQMQMQNGNVMPSPSGQPVQPMDPSPAPPGYRMNQVPAPFKMAGDVVPFPNPLGQAANQMSPSSLPQIREAGAAGNLGPEQLKHIIAAMMQQKMRQGR